jgi:hypothetical protein
MMMQGQEPVEEAAFEWSVMGQEHALGLVGGHGEDSSPTGRNGRKSADRRPPSTPCHK